MTASPSASQRRHAAARARTMPAIYSGLAVLWLLVAALHWADDGLLDLAVITAEGLAQWAGTVGRTIAGHPERSPSFRVTRGRKVKVKLDRKVLYELDGGARSKAKSYRLEVEPGAITVCVPATSRNGDGTA